MELQGQIFAENLNANEVLGIECAVMVALRVEVDRQRRSVGQRREMHDRKSEQGIQETGLNALDDLRRKGEASLLIGKFKRNFPDFKKESRATAAQMGIRRHVHAGEKSQLSITRGVDEY